MTGKTNLAASVAARLLIRARETGDDHQILLTSYCLERFLYRLGVSDVRDRFVLKGAMLLRLWSDQPYRATRDLDLLRRGDGAFEAMLVLGDRNSRIKDFFDLHHLAGHFEFDRATLSEAVRLTLERRRTPVPSEDPLGLTSVYWDNPSRPAQVRAFARRAGLEVPARPAEEFTRPPPRALNP